MTGIHDHAASTPQVTGPWRKSSFSNQVACVEVAPTADGGVALRNSKRPEAGTLELTRAQLATLVAGAAAGGLADLA